MAVEPLYNADLDTLLKRARIETADDDNTLALVYMTVTEVRTGFYGALGTTRASTIAGYPLVDNPTTDNEILRARGATTEALWLTYLLAQRLPYLFMDNAASTGDVFNDEQLTRDASGIAQFLKELKAQIDDGLGDMQEPPDTNTGSTKASSITADEVELTYTNFPGLYPSGTNASINVGTI